MIDFPNAPLNGQIFTSGGSTWTYDGSKWVASGTIPLTPQATGDNRIINGDMRIDQRNNGASGTANATYTLDRWRYSCTQTPKGTWQRYSGPSLIPFGFSNAWSFVSSSAYTPLATDSFTVYQPIEADTVSDFAWGTANAQPVTLSCLVFSSLTGTFGGSIRNDTNGRSCPFAFSVPVAGVWTKCAVTIPGDTAGTWVMSGNAAALNVTFDLGSGANFRAPAGAWASGNYTGANGSVSVVGTNGATFYVTGVKLEIGSVATPFNRQSLAKSLADCQRYYQTGLLFGAAYNIASNVIAVSTALAVTPRTSVTVALISSSNANVTGFALATGAGPLMQSVWATGTATATGAFTFNAQFSASAEL